MEFLGWFLTLAVAAAILQVLVVSASWKRCTKAKEKYCLKKAERCCIFLALIIPPLIFFAYDLAFFSAGSR